MYSRQGKAITNFHQTLPEKQALMAGQILKGSLQLWLFLTLEPQVQELDVERQLTEHITKFLLELGKGFAFIGRQYPLQVGDKTTASTCSFTHSPALLCGGGFESGGIWTRFAGKMNFYLSVVDDQLKTADDQPSVASSSAKIKQAGSGICPAAVWTNRWRKWVYRYPGLAAWTEKALCLRWKIWKRTQ